MAFRFFSQMTNGLTGNGSQFLKSFLCSAIGGTACLLGLLLVLDPLGTGRLLPKAMDRPVALGANPAFSSAARLRDTAFNAYVFGNSTLQTLDPERLNTLTGLRFGQATVPGTGPLEQGAMLRYVASQRGSQVRAIVLGLDIGWCDPTLETKSRNPFPLWLYAPTSWMYIQGLFRASNLEMLPRRIALLLGVEKPPRRDGYWNYELYVPPRPYPFQTPVAPQFGKAPHSGAATLTNVLRVIPEDTKVVIIFAPLYRSPDGVLSFAEATSTGSCKAELLAATASRANVAIVDHWRDSEFNRDRKNFLDAVHMLAPLAREIERAAAREVTR